MRPTLLALAMLSLLGCNSAAYRVRRVASPAREYHFQTRCKFFEDCVKDARDVCPSGYRKEEVKEHELVFMCVGKPDW